MCGIAGFLNLDGRPADTVLLKSMARALRHRGPDGEGFHCDGGLGLAHRRLSILDLAGGGQPMTTTDGRSFIVFNGEIYNYIELRRELESRGHPFSTASDTETILHLYEERGDACVESLRGMFAFALWDGARRRLLLARDRLGIKPLHYFRTANVMAFASEIKALRVHPDAPDGVDPVALSDFLTFLYVPGPRTAFEGILKLPPAHVLVADEAGCRLRRYWTPPDTVEERPAAAYGEELVETLQEAVRIHMRSDVPVGALLSGGLDSSLIVALASRETPEPLRTFSVGFSDREISELPYARDVVQRYGTAHNEHLLEPESLETLPALVAHFDEPFGDASAVPCSAIAAVAARSVKVCLSGDGGDEAFAGYNAYATADRLRAMDAMPLALRRLFIGPIARVWPEWLRGKGLLRFLTLPAADRYMELMGSADHETRRWLLTPGFRSASASEDPYDRMRALHAKYSHLDEVARLQRIDLETYLPDDILVKADRTSMLHSLELRVPLLDHKVIELALRMPTPLKLRDGVRKAILRDTFAPLFPPSILGRGKQGFGLPLDAWFRGNLTPMMRDLFHDSRTRQRGIFEPSGLDRLSRGHARGSRDLSNEIWSVLILEFWYRAHVDGAAPAARTAAAGA